MRGLRPSFLLQLAGAIALVQGGLHLVFRDAGLRGSLIEFGIGLVLLTVGLVLRWRERHSGQPDPEDP